MHKKCTTVGEADKRFGEDALRLMRAIRMVNTLNTQLTKHFGGSSLFDFSPTTRESIQTNAHLLPYVAKERVKEELTKIFVKGDPFGSIVLLNVSGMLAHLFPALFATKYNEQPIRYHAFDTYTHTLLALKALQEINSDYLVRFAMLYHDVGKVAQYAAYEKATSKEEIRAIISGPLNHRNSSPELMKQDFKALGFSGKEIETIARYILEHHTPGEILQSNPAHREKKVRKLLSEKGFEMVNNLFDINIADRMGQFNPLQGSADLTDSYQLKTLLKKLNEEEGQFKKSDLAINGTMIMKHLKLAPGAIIGELLKQAFDRVLNDIPTRNTEQEILIYLKNYLRNKVVNPTNNSTMKE
ncbi:MAG: HD domain-containing protein [Candidatus Peribacteria bacterium]|nr:HD domain-containing protein [Candidatus Peribacteria bacterium]